MICAAADEVHRNDSITPPSLGCLVFSTVLASWPREIGFSSRPRMLSLNRMPGPFLSLDNQKIPVHAGQTGHAAATQCIIPRTALCVRGDDSGGQRPRCTPSNCLSLDSLSLLPPDLPVVPMCRRHASLWRRANHWHFFARPVPDERGAWPIVTSVGRGMRWTRMVRETKRIDADGEVVWSRYPDADIKPARR
jgi:hypothetical protein